MRRGNWIMDYSVLERSTLFNGVPAERLREALQSTPHHIQCYDKEETIFRMMEPALRIGIVMEGRAQAQKSFPNGSQVNVSVRGPGELVGPAAVFSSSRRYPCDLYASTAAGAFVLQWDCTESGFLAFDAGKAIREGFCQNPGHCFKVGNADERIQAIPSS